MTNGVPEISDAGFDQAVARAAQARRAIHTIIDQVRAAELDLSAAFAAADSDELMGRCFAVKVFEVVPGIGKVRARRTMEQFGIDEGIWIRDVTPQDRERVIAALAEPSQSA